MLLAAVVEMERDLLVERTQAGLVRAKAEGKTLGRPTKTTLAQRVAMVEAHVRGDSISRLSRLRVKGHRSDRRNTQGAKMKTMPDVFGNLSKWAVIIEADVEALEARIAELEMSRATSTARSEPDFCQSVSDEVVSPFPSINAEKRSHVNTSCAAHWMSRKPQTLRQWACLENGPLRPIRINGRLAWSVEEIRQVMCL